MHDNETGDLITKNRTRTKFYLQRFPIYQQRSHSNKYKKTSVNSLGKYINIKIDKSALRSRNIISAIDRLKTEQSQPVQNSTQLKIYKKNTAQQQIKNKKQIRQNREDANLSSKNIHNFHDFMIQNQRLQKQGNYVRRLQQNKSLILPQMQKELKQNTHTKSKQKRFSKTSMGQPNKISNIPNNRSFRQQKSRLNSQFSSQLQSIAPMMTVSCKYIGNLKSWLHQRQIQILADQKKQTQIQQEFYSLQLPVVVQQQNIPVYKKPEINDIATFQYPKLPNPPSLKQSSNAYIDSIIDLCNLFNIKINYFDVQIKKFHNCIIFIQYGTKKALIRYYNGNLYYGDWKVQQSNQLSQIKGSKQGQGIEYFGSQWYKGQFVKSKREGKGVLMKNNGDIYEGLWKSNFQEGQGIYYYKKSKYYYVGNWKKGKIHGKGQIIYEQNHFYRGNLLDSKKDGFGYEVYPNGDVYLGEYKDNYFEGKGRYYWKSGSYYQGSFRKGVRCGIGFWKACKKNGQQNIQNDEISRKIYYFGEFNNNERCGYGIQYKKNGDLYKGYFLKNLKNGIGIQKKGNGTVIKATWKYGKAIQIQKTQQFIHKPHNNK